MNSKVNTESSFIWSLWKNINELTSSVTVEMSTGLATILLRFVDSSYTTSFRLEPIIMNISLPICVQEMAFEGTSRFTVSNLAGSYMGLELKPYQIVKRSGESTNIKNLQ